MTTFIIAALSADGFIAKDPSHSAFWTSKEDKARFVALTKAAGTIVMGSTTFATLPRPLKERHNIVYSRSQDKHLSDAKYEGVEVTQENPADLVARLKASATPPSGLAVCGGSHIYTMFMKANVVDKLYLTVEPIIFGKGMTLFNEDLKFHLKLVGRESTENGTVLLEYDVDYSGTPRI